MADPDSLALPSTADGGLLRSRKGFDWRHRTGLRLAVLTGLIHLYVGTRVDSAFGAPFYLAGIGWFVGAAVFLTVYWRRWMYLLAAAYAAVQMAVWVLSGLPLLTIGLADKLAQVGFVALAVWLYREG